MKMTIKNFDARPKMALWLSSMITGLVLPIDWPLVIYFALIVAMVVLVNGCVKSWTVFALRLVLPTTVMLFVVYGFLVPANAESTLIKVGGIVLSISGLWVSLGIAARLLIIGGATLAFMKNTTPTELSDGLRALSVPATLVAMFVSSFSIHTLVIRKIHQIANAQRSRGLRPRVFIIDRLRMYIPILRPLLFTMLNAAVERSTLWQSRGYLKMVNKQKRKMHWWDALAILLSIVFVVCAVFTRWLI